MASKALTTSELEALDLIKPINETMEHYLVEFIFTVRRALSLSTTNQLLVLEKAVKSVPRIKISQNQPLSWTYVKQTIYLQFGINESPDHLYRKLKNVQMHTKSLDMYYSEVADLVRDLIILEYDNREWREMFSVMLEIEQEGVEAFIEGVKTDYATYLMIKRPKCLKDAYELLKVRMEKDRIYDDMTRDDILPNFEPNQSSLDTLVRKLPSRFCASLLLKTNLPTSRKHLFHVWQRSPANFIKVTSLPEKTLFAWTRNTFKCGLGDIQTVGVINILLYIKQQRVGPFSFYVLPESSKIEDDGIINFNNGVLGETNDGFSLIINLQRNETEEFKLGLDCPKRGKCGHWPSKIFLGNGNK